MVTSPKFGWEEIEQSNIPVGKVLRTVYVPLLFVLAISCFVPRLYDSTVTVYSSFMEGVVLFWSFFIAYFIIIYIIGCSYQELVKTEGGSARLNDYILYNLIFLVMLMILRHLLPTDFTPVLFLLLYLPWMAYKGVDHLYIKREKAVRFVIISSVLVLGVPFVLQLIFGLFIIK